MTREGSDTGATFKMVLPDEFVVGAGEERRNRGVLSGDIDR